MEVRDLEAFLAVMSTGSITGAARLLDRSQSQVTRLIQDLETSLGFALFERNGPRIAPTDKGIAFHEDAERFVSGIGHLRNRAKAIAGKEPEPIEIAATPAFASGIIPIALAELPEHLLPHTINLRSMPAEAAVQSVFARTADFCVTSLPADQPGLDVQGFFEGRCVAAVAPHDPLAAKDVISIADLAGRTLVTMSNPFGCAIALMKCSMRPACGPIALSRPTRPITPCRSHRSALAWRSSSRRRPTVCNRRPSSFGLSMSRSPSYGRSCQPARARSRPAFGNSFNG